LGNPSSPPSTALQRGGHSSSAASVGGSISSPSFVSPLVRRGSACLQAVKAKQAERLRRDTPMPPRSKSLSELSTASGGSGSMTTPTTTPKSILRQSTSLGGAGTPRSEGKCDGDNWGCRRIGYSSLFGCVQC